MLRHTTTLGVRWQAVRRMTLDREPVNLQSPWGEVKGKRSFGHGIERVKAEFDEVARIAREEGLSVDEVTNALGAD